MCFYKTIVEAYIILISPSHSVMALCSPLRRVSRFNLMAGDLVTLYSHVSPMGNLEVGKGIEVTSIYCRDRSSAQPTGRFSVFRVCVCFLLKCLEASSSWLTPSLCSSCVSDAGSEEAGVSTAEELPGRGERLDLVREMSRVCMRCSWSVCVCGWRIFSHLCLF